MRVRACLFFLLALAASLLFKTPQATAAELRTEVEARQVAIGQRFSVRLVVVMADGDPDPDSPRLDVSGPAEVFGPSVGSERRMIMRNFDVKTETNVVYTWSVAANKTGKLTVGPPTVRVGGRVLRGQAVTVEVVDGPPRSASPRRRDPFGFGRSPFGQDPFSQDPFDRDPLDFLQQRSGPPQAPEELTLDAAPDPIAFLHARLDKRRVVLGEPLTLEIYAYGSRGSFREISPTEPSLGNFLSYPAVETSHEQPMMRTDIAGQEFLVVKLREIVLVPLKTGTLTVGPMKAVLRGAGRRYPARGSQLGTTVESAPLTIEVTQPPTQGRPEDYQLGDVGQFALSATLEPKELTVGDYASLRVQIRGTGNVPAAIRLPELPSVVWGTPTVTGELEVRNGELAGSRLLSYTPQFTTPGQLDIGELRLPFYDPEKKRYRVARVELGSVRVLPGQSPGARGSDPDQALAPPSDLPLGDAPLEPRRRLRAFQPRPPAPPSWAFALVGGIPLLAWLLSLLGRVLGRLRAHTQRRRQKPSLDKHALQRAARSGDASMAAKTLERAGYQLMEDRFGILGRGVLRSHLQRELEQAGVESDLAQEVGTFFVRLEEIRYRADSTTPDVASGLIQEGERLLRRLEKAKVEAERTRGVGR